MIDESRRPREQRSFHHEGFKHVRKVTFFSKQMSPKNRTSSYVAIKLTALTDLVQKRFERQSSAYKTVQMANAISP